MEIVRKHCGHNAECGRSRCGRYIEVHSWATIPRPPYASDQNWRRERPGNEAMHMTLLLLDIECGEFKFPLPMYK